MALWPLTSIHTDRAFTVVTRKGAYTGAQSKDKAAARLAWLAAAVLIWAAVIFTKLILLQVIHHSDYKRMAQQQQESLVEIPAPRGTIYDRTGHPLAMSLPTQSVFLNPLRVPDASVAAEILARILNLDAGPLYSRINTAARHHRGFLWIKRKITPLEAERLRSLNLEWIEFQTESQRNYPKGGLAAHVLGSVDYAEKGNAGFEKSFDKELRGRPGAVRLLADVKRRGIDSQVSAEARAGSSVTLSIDERIQFTAERELRRAAMEHHARSGSVVVMNPYNGEILALANYPTFDPNSPLGPAENPRARFNLATSVPFEPGSVFKVVTLSAAFETARIRPDTMIDCHNGVFNYYGRLIHEAKHGYGGLTVAQVLEKSSNIGAIQIGLKAGEKNLYEYVRRFGFGVPTSIPLPAEARGMVRKLSHWTKTSIASVAMGQEVSTTSLQLAQACSVFANGGLLVKPKLVISRNNKPEPTAAPVRILKPQTAITMRQIMEGVVLRGTAKNRVRLEGYSAGGKTGTAQIFDLATRHYTHLYNASFMGFAPVTNPAVVVVVTLIGTSGTSGYGGAAAAPVFNSVAMQALRVLDVPKDLPDLPSQPAGQPADADDLAIADLAQPAADLFQEPVQETPLPGPQPLIALEQPGPKVPSFEGKSMRAVVEEASALGLPVVLDGTGIARGQIPLAGSPLHEGERIRIQFAR